MEPRPVTSASPRVGLFVTCLVDAMRPRSASPPSSCWRRPAARSRCRRPRPAAASPPSTAATRRPPPASPGRSIEAFEPLRLCRGAIGLLRRDDPAALSRRRSPAIRAWGTRAEAFGGEDLRDHELPGRCPRLPARKGARFAATATYHDSCAGLRELGVLAQPRQLLAAVDRARDAQARGQRRLLRLRRHLLRQIPGHLQRHRRGEGGRPSRRPGPSSCSPAISAA